MFRNTARGVRDRWHGLVVCVIVALSAGFLASQYQAPVLLMALLLGTASGFLAENPVSRPGVDFAAGTLLRSGVALLGFRVMAGDLLLLGWNTVGLLAAAAAATIGSGVLLAKVFRLDRELGALSGGAVAICGVSAAIAISSVMPRTETIDRHLAITIVSVTVFGSLAMVFYPAFVTWAGFEPVTAAVFLGASIHDVSHVVGAGYSVSAEVGDMAVLTKMLRVVLLVPVVWGFFWAFRAHVATARRRQTLPLPWFLGVFLVFAAIASVDAVPEAVVRISQSASHWLLVVAIAALGMKTSMRALLSTGWRPIALVFGESVLLGALVLAWCLVTL